MANPIVGEVGKFKRTELWLKVVKLSVGTVVCAQRKFGFANAKKINKVKIYFTV